MRALDAREQVTLARLCWKLRRGDIVKFVKDIRTSFTRSEGSGWKALRQRFVFCFSGCQQADECQDGCQRQVIADKLQAVFPCEPNGDVWRE